jgi:hypothetical protein
MALIPTLTISDSTTFSDVINFSVTDSLTVTAPSSSLTTVVATATGGATVIIPAATGTRYLFIRHTGTTDGSSSTTQDVDIEDEDNNTMIRLGPGEWAFFPVSVSEASKAIQLQVDHASVVQLEYAYWTKGG